MTATSDSPFLTNKLSSYGRKAEVKKDILIYQLLTQGEQNSIKFEFRLPNELNIVLFLQDIAFE